MDEGGWVSLAPLLALATKECPPVSGMPFRELLVAFLVAVNSEEAKSRIHVAVLTSTNQGVPVYSMDEASRCFMDWNLENGKCKVIVRCLQGHSVPFVHGPRLALNEVTSSQLRNGSTCLCHVTPFSIAKFDVIMESGILPQCTIVENFEYGYRTSVYLSTVGPSDILFEKAAGQRACEDEKMAMVIYLDEAVADVVKLYLMPSSSVVAGTGIPVEFINVVALKYESQPEVVIWRKDRQSCSVVAACSGGKWWRSQNQNEVWEAEALPPVQSLSDFLLYDSEEAAAQARMSLRPSVYPGLRHLGIFVENDDMSTLSDEVVPAQNLLCKVITPEAMLLPTKGQVEASGSISSNYRLPRFQCPACQTVLRSGMIRCISPGCETTFKYGKWLSSTEREYSVSQSDDPYVRLCVRAVSSESIESSDGLTVESLSDQTIIEQSSKFVKGLITNKTKASLLSFKVKTDRHFYSEDSTKSWNSCVHHEHWNENTEEAVKKRKAWSRNMQTPGFRDPGSVCVPVHQVLNDGSVGKVWISDVDQLPDDHPWKLQGYNPEGLPWSELLAQFQVMFDENTTLSVNVHPAKVYGAACLFLGSKCSDEFTDHLSDLAPFYEVKRHHAVQVARLKSDAAQGGWSKAHLSSSLEQASREHNAALKDVTVKSLQAWATLRERKTEDIEDTWIIMIRIISRMISANMEMSRVSHLLTAKDLFRLNLYRIGHGTPAVDNSLAVDLKATVEPVDGAKNKAEDDQVMKYISNNRSQANILEVYNQKVRTAVEQGACLRVSDIMVMPKARPTAPPSTRTQTTWSPSIKATVPFVQAPSWPSSSAVAPAPPVETMVAGNEGQGLSSGSQSVAAVGRLAPMGNGGTASPSSVAEGSSASPTRGAGSAGSGGSGVPAPQVPPPAPGRLQLSKAKMRMTFNCSVQTESVSTKGGTVPPLYQHELISLFRDEKRFCQLVNDVNFRATALPSWMYKALKRVQVSLPARESRYKPDSADLQGMAAVHRVTTDSAIVCRRHQFRPGWFSCDMKLSPLTKHNDPFEGRNANGYKTFWAPKTSHSQVVLCEDNYKLMDAPFSRRPDGSTVKVGVVDFAGGHVYGYYKGTAFAQEEQLFTQCPEGIAHVLLRGDDKPIYLSPKRCNVETSVSVNPVTFFTDWDSSTAADLRYNFKWNVEDRHVRMLESHHRSIQDGRNGISAPMTLIAVQAQHRGRSSGQVDDWYTVPEILWAWCLVLHTIRVAQYHGCHELMTGWLGGGAYRGSRPLILVGYWIFAQHAMGDRADDQNQLAIIMHASFYRSHNARFENPSVMAEECINVARAMYEAILDCKDIRDAAHRLSCCGVCSSGYDKDLLLENFKASAHVKVPPVVQAKGFTYFSDQQARGSASKRSASLGSNRYGVLAEDEDYDGQSVRTEQVVVSDPWQEARQGGTAGEAWSAFKTCRANSAGTGQGYLPRGNGGTASTRAGGSLSRSGGNVAAIPCSSYEANVDLMRANKLTASFSMLGRTFDVSKLALPTEVGKPIKGKANLADSRKYAVCDAAWYPGSPAEKQLQYGLMPKVGTVITVDKGLSRITKGLCVVFAPSEMTAKETDKEQDDLLIKLEVADKFYEQRCPVNGQVPVPFPPGTADLVQHEAKSYGDVSLAVLTTQRNQQRLGAEGTSSPDEPKDMMFWFINSLVQLAWMNTSRVWYVSHQGAAFLAGLHQEACMRVYEALAVRMGLLIVVCDPVGKSRYSSATGQPIIEWQGFPYGLATMIERWSPSRLFENDCDPRVMYVTRYFLVLRRCLQVASGTPLESLILITALSDVALPEVHVECFRSEVARFASHLLGETLEITPEIKVKLKPIWDVSEPEAMRTPVAFAFPEKYEKGHLQAIVRDTGHAAGFYVDYWTAQLAQPRGPVKEWFPVGVWHVWHADNLESMGGDSSKKKKTLRPLKGDLPSAGAVDRSIKADKMLTLHERGLVAPNLVERKRPLDMSLTADKLFSLEEVEDDEPQPKRSNVTTDDHQEVETVDL